MKTLQSKITINAKIVTGKGRGKKIGVPTINFSIPKNLSLQPGVYAAWLYIKNNRYPTAIHFGQRPVFKEEDMSLEAHIINNNIPPEIPDQAEIELLSYIRPIQTFSSVPDMVKQIKKDIEEIKTILALKNRSPS